MRTLFMLMSCFLALAVSLSAYAQDAGTLTVEKQVIISPSPKAVCTAVAAHWEGNVWVATHDICKYENRSEGSAWVNDYWSCTEANTAGTCLNWVLVPGHWVKTTE